MTLAISIIVSLIVGYFVGYWFAAMDSKGYHERD